MYKNLMKRYFSSKISFLIFRRPKKFSTKSFLTFRELQPIVSYKRVSYKKIRVIEYNYMFNHTVHCNHHCTVYGLVL